jgi:hypothetical protein
MEPEASSSAQIELELHTFDKRIVTLLFGRSPERGFRLEIAPDVSIEYVGTEVRPSAIPGLPEVVHVLVGIGTGVVTKIASDWLYQKIKGEDQVIKLQVNRMTVKVTKSELERSFKQAIRNSKKQR